MHGLSSVADDFSNLDHGGLVIKNIHITFLTDINIHITLNNQHLNSKVSQGKLMRKLFMNSFRFLSHLSCYFKLPAGNDAGNDEANNVITSVPGAVCAAGELHFTLKNVVYVSVSLAKLLFILSCDAICVFYIIHLLFKLYYL